MENKTIIRMYTPEDKQEIIHLYEKVWQKEKAQRIAQLWQWKYHNHPWQEKEMYPSRVVERNKKIIGFIGAYPAKIKLGEKTLDGLWLGDFMIDPDHRGFAGYRLAKAILEQEPVLLGKTDNGTEEGAISYRLWKKLVAPKKFDMTPVYNFTKRISIENTIKRMTKSLVVAVLCDKLWMLLQDIRLKFRKPNADSEILVKKITHFDEQCEELFKTIMDESVNVSYRTVEYMNWRYVQMPATEYTILIASRNTKPTGYIILRAVKELGKLNGRIVELMVLKDQKTTPAALLEKANRFFRGNKVGIVTAFNFRDEFIQDALERAGYSQFGRSSEALKYIVQCPNKDCFYSERWRIFMGDSDYEMD